MHRQQLMRHARILRVMMKTGAPLERVGDSFLRLAEHPDFLRRSQPVHDPSLEAHLWSRAIDRQLVDRERAGGPVPLMRHGPARLIHGTMPGTGLLPVIVCWFEADGHGLFIATDFGRGHDYHRLTRRRPAHAPRPTRRWRPFARSAVTPA